ncbi:hypothetical protein BXZ70DRAFT_961776 [Cristinia sonorae]|uniref:Uncharacterized protein n=1 Tax=Cristinia sonorae TaxID=1940300 RepID=A0A8K0XK30_9AGAR|nr:hypothetical protein BXZ70DRAFT_961776 [Cristinia sonorae]
MPPRKYLKPSPPLPVEVWEVIIDFVARIFVSGSSREWQRRTLYACTLTCRAFVPRASFHLSFHRVATTTYLRSRAELTEVVDLLKIRPGLAGVVDVLVVQADDDGDNQAWVSAVPMQLGVKLKNITTLKLVSVDLTRRHPDFYRALKLFRAVKCVELVATRYSLCHQISQLANGWATRLVRFRHASGQHADISHSPPQEPLGELFDVDWTEKHRSVITTSVANILFISRGRCGILTTRVKSLVINVQPSRLRSKLISLQDKFSTSEYGDIFAAMVNLRRTVPLRRVRTVTLTVPILDLRFASESYLPHALPRLLVFEDHLWNVGLVSLLACGKVRNVAVVVHPGRSFKAKQDQSTRDIEELARRWRRADDALDSQFTRLPYRLELSFIGSHWDLKYLPPPCKISDMTSIIAHLLPKSAAWIELNFKSDYECPYAKWRANPGWCCDECDTKANEGSVIGADLTS